MKFSRGAKSVFGCAPAFGCSVFPPIFPFCIKIRRKLAKQVPNKGKMKKNSKNIIFDHLMQCAASVGCSKYKTNNWALVKWKHLIKGLYLFSNWIVQPITRPIKWPEYWSKSPVFGSHYIGALNICHGKVPELVWGC